MASLPVDYQANVSNIATSAGTGRPWAPKLIVAVGLLAALIGGLLAFAEPEHQALWQGSLGLALAAPVFGSVGIVIALRRERAAWVAVTAGFVVTFAAGKLGMPGGAGLPARAWSAGDVLWLGRFVVLYGGLLSLVVVRTPQFGVRQVLRRGCSPREATTELVRCRGTQFDPEVVDAFLALVATHDQQQAA